MEFKIGRKVIWVVFLFLFIFLYFCTAFGQQYEWKITKSKSGNQLYIKYNKNTGKLHRIMGLIDNLKNYGNFNESSIKQAGNNFIKKSSDFLKIKNLDLKFERTYFKNNKWNIVYNQYYKGIPVFKASLDLLVYENGNIGLIGLNTYNDVKIKNFKSLPRKNALDIACSDLRTLSGDEIVNVYKSPELFVLPVKKENGHSYYLIYYVQLLSENYNESYFINAENGEILKKFSNIEGGSLSGTIKVKYWPQYQNVGTTEGYYKHAYLRLYNLVPKEISDTYTNSSGYYLFTGVSSGNYILKTTFDGYYVNIIDKGIAPPYEPMVNSPIGPPYEWIISGPTYPSNTYYHINEIHDYFKNTFGFSGNDYQMDVYIRDDQVSYGYGGGWTNGTYIRLGWSRTDENCAAYSDIMYHEYTHTIIYKLYNNNFIDGTNDYYTEGNAMDEAFPDYFACHLNNDDEFAEQCLESDYIRDLSNNIRMDQWRGN